MLFRGFAVNGIPRVKTQGNSPSGTLNSKTQDDRQPIPRIQDILNSLSGNTYFSVLDQGEAYHQGFVAAEHRHLTAFITPWG